MDLEGDSPAPRHFPTPESVATQDIQVTPENVVALAVLFRECADRLQVELRHMGALMHTRIRLLADPVSEWAAAHLSGYLFGRERAFVKIIQTDFEQHSAVRDALVRTAKDYGLTEELIAAGFTDLTPPR